jgi:type IX secretion system PorP/SprF family membrane protein
MIQHTRAWRLPILLAVCLFANGYVAEAQQEQMYSQYMFNMLHINPAYAGNRAADNITAMYRNQWVGVSGAPRTATLSWDRRSSESNVGYGLSLYNDRVGIETSTGAQAFYSYHIPMDNAFLSFGVSAGVVNYKALYSESVTTDPGDPQFQEDVSSWLPSAGFGALYATDRWYVGFSIPALLKTKIYLNDEEKVKDNIHFYLTSGYIWDLSDYFNLKPSLMIKKTIGAPFQFDFNVNCWFKNRLALGVSYRTGNAFVGMLEVQITPIVRLGYAFDYTTESLSYYSKGTHELMLRVEIPGKDCPWCKSKQEDFAPPRYY